MQQKIDNVIAVLQQAVNDFSPACFPNSRGGEDLGLTDIFPNPFPPPNPPPQGGEGANDPLREPLYPIEMFSLDTGRLPQETYDLMQEVSERYPIPLKVYFPDSAAVERYVAQNGVNGFYNSVDSRKSCCFARKVEPLRRAHAAVKAIHTILCNVSFHCRTVRKINI